MAGTQSEDKDHTTLIFKHAHFLAEDEEVFFESIPSFVVTVIVRQRRQCFTLRTTTALSQPNVSGRVSKTWNKAANGQHRCARA